MTPERYSEGLARTSLRTLFRYDVAFEADPETASPTNASTALAKR